MITATLAAQPAGIAAPINGALSRDHIAELVRRAGSRILITAAPELDATTWDTAQHLIDTGCVDKVLLLRPTGGHATVTPTPGANGTTVAYFGDLAEKHDGSAFLGQPPAAEDIAALFDTGGTTGKPKPAAHTHANEVTDAWMIAANSLLDEHWVLFAALPLFHVNALVVTLLSPVLRGQQVVWAGPLGYRDPAFYANYWKIVQQNGIAAMSAVPNVLRGPDAMPGRRRHHQSAVRVGGRLGASRGGAQGFRVAHRDSARRRLWTH
ncbi:MAG: acyl-CoA synthetase (AMP-forming)/AMP-acid ligase [Mycobacterium sp.]|nr:acyl-CoA synthetase (AMP-forming)/AMP-acid ligase [Mycobacterium sp.]